MDDTEIMQNIDFLTLAVEEIEAESHESAVEFIEEVISNLEEEYAR